MPTPIENHDIEGCFVCGARNPSGMHIAFRPTGPGAVEAAAHLDAAWTGWRGLAHGGLVATMLDEALGQAVATLGRTALTGRLEVRYLVPVPPDQDLLIRARVLRHDRRVADAESEALLPDGRVVARAHAAMFLCDVLPRPPVGAGT